MLVATHFHLYSTVCGICYIVIMQYQQQVIVIAVWLQIPVDIFGLVLYMTENVMTAETFLIALDSSFNLWF